MFKQIVITCSLILAPITFCYAQLKFDHLQSDVGFDVINAVYRDTDGYLWIGNYQQGLMRHNSYETVVYEYLEEDSTSLSNNGINKLFQDAYGRLWIATRKGLNRYIKQTNSFKRYLYDPSDTTTLNDNSIFSIYEDDSLTLWIVTSKGPHKYLPEIDGFKRYGQSSSILSKLTPNAMIKDKTGQYWIATYEPGLWLFDPTRDTVIHYNHDPIMPNRKKFRSLFLDDDNKIWISSKGNGIYIFDPIAKSYEKLLVNENGTGLNSNFTTDIAKWGDKILIGIDQGGINIYDTKTKTFSYVKGADNLSSDGIYCFHIDHEGIIWVGTSRGGVNFYNPNKYHFKTYSKKSNNQHGTLSYNIVGCFFEDDNGDIWIGTDGGGIDILKRKTDSFIHFDDIIDQPKSTYDIRVIRSISKDKSGCYWIATWSEGIWKYDPKTRKVKKIKFEHSLKKLQSTPFWKMYIDKKDRFWITLVEGELYLLDHNMSLISHFFQDRQNITGSYPLIYEIDEKIYMTNWNGIYLLKEDSLSLEQLANVNDVLDFSMDDKNMYAITINDGLYVIDHNGTITSHFYKTTHLPTKYLQSIEMANNGTLWISSSNGLCEFDPKQNTFRSFTKRDGLQDNLYFIQSSYKTRKGELLFGGVLGFNLFIPENININKTPPPVYIEKIKLIDKAIPKQDIEYTKSGLPKIKLKWYDKMVTFDFVGINFTTPEKNQYKYKLEGFDNDWIETSAKQRNATYTNLPPGKYQFSVKASNNSGIWNTKGANMILYIKPPFWKEPWFLFCTIAFIAMTTLTYIERSKYKLRRDKEILTEKVRERTNVIQEQHNLLNEQNKEIQAQNEELRMQNEVLHEQRDMIYDLNKNLEKKVHQKTSELTVTIKELNKTVSELDRFIYSTSHELSAPMKSVLGLVNIAKRDLNGNMEQYLQHIEKSIYKQEDVIKALVNFSRNSRTAVKKEDINLKEMVSNSIEELKYMDGFNTINFQIDLEDNLTINTDFIRLKMIINNLLSNAIKYANHKKDENWVKISGKQQKHSIILSVLDNGIGIEKEFLHQVFDMFFRATEKSSGSGLGLYIVMESIKRLNGEVLVKSEINVGSEFTLIFPIA